MEEFRAEAERITLSLHTAVNCLDFLTSHSHEPNAPTPERGAADGCMLASPALLYRDRCVLPAFASVCSPGAWLRLEYVDGGSLYNMLRVNQGLTEEHRMGIVRGIARGLNHLHYEKIVHR